ncbi:hypothetical protein FACS1894110_15820 [Spirochaetia bacterium]|nr:hypothetical protein FACS1894110_15820 [Spirochaetia bacterium]
MTFLEHRKCYGNDYDNFQYFWHNTNSRLFYLHINKIYEELTIKIKSRIIKDIENIHDDSIKTIEATYRIINIKYFLNEMEKLYNFIENRTESSFFNNENNNNKNEIKKALKKLIDSKQMFFEDVDIYNKMLLLYSTFEIIEGYFQTFNRFLDLIDNIFSDVIPNYSKEIEKNCSEAKLNGA